MEADPLIPVTFPDGLEPPAMSFFPGDLSDLQEVS